MRPFPLLALALLLAGCTQPSAPLPGGGAPAPIASMILATTTSTKDTGLLDFLLPDFERAHSVEVKVVAVGTGRALELGRTGDADVVLVHAPKTERAYLANGSYVARHEVMYNQFFLVGPSGDLADLLGAANVSVAFRNVFDQQAAFVSRGDNSGTHLREQELWALAGLDHKTQVVVPANRWYRSVGQGMGATLRIASEQRAYTLSDDGTWYAVQPQGMVVVKSNEPPLHNQYSVMLPSASAQPGLAEAFADWLVSPATQERIGAFEVRGHQLFTPNAGVVERVGGPEG